MNYQEISDMWQIDGTIDRSELGHASLMIPHLHNKYFKLFSKARINLRKIEDEIECIKLLKTEYYQGNLDGDTLKENGWEQWDRRILKGDIPSHLAADKDIQAMKMKLAMSFEKVDLLDTILKQVTSMNWNIKNAIEWERFKAGIV